MTHGPTILGSSGCLNKGPQTEGIKIFQWNSELKSAISVPLPFIPISVPPQSLSLDQGTEPCQVQLRGNGHPGLHLETDFSNVEPIKQSEI